MTSVHENLTRREAMQRATSISDVAYCIELDLTRGDDVFGATTRVTFSARPGTSTFLDCTANEISSVVLNGTPLDLDRVVAPTRIQLPDLARHNKVEVVATMPYLHEGRGMHHFRDPTDDRVYLHTQFEPFDAHQVVACFDQPDLKATCDIAVSVPANWVVVSNMPVTRAPDDGEAGQWVFATTPPLSPYVLAVVAGEYASVHATHASPHGEVPLGLYVRQSLRDRLDADELFDITRRGLDWYNDNFGIPYPFGKYDQLFVPEFSAGAMENPGCVTFSENYVFRGAVTAAQRERRCETMLHEMAHMWFGDLVTMRWWDDLWLNESFASFSAVLAQVEATWFTDGWVTFLDDMKAWAKHQDQLPSTHPIAANMHDIESVHQNFDGITYAKGASVLRQLVAWVGQDEFLVGVRDYFNTHQYDNAELADFLAALEASSGRDLSPWRDAWLTTSGINTMRAVHEIGNDGTFTEFTIQQSAPDQHPTLRPHRMAVGVYDEEDGAIVRTHRMEVDITGDSTEVPELVGVAAGTMVVVNDDDLTYAKVAVDDRTLQVATNSLAHVAQPMPRALLWSTAWDMVRDAQMPASQYVDMARANVAAETNIGVVTRTLQRAEGAAVRYADPGNRPDLLAALADFCLDQLRGTSSGNDRQVVWARQFARTATTETQLAQLAELRSGALAFDGLKLDQDLSWRLVVALATAGLLEEGDIDTAAAADPSDYGQREATTARAARPTHAAKEQAWSMLLDDTTLTHTLARQVWGGFQQMTQPDLVAEWVTPYIQALDQVWDQRSTEWAIEFATGMFPHAAASPDLLQRARTVRDRDDLPRPLQRVLAEQVDILERTLAARERDRRG